MSDPDVDNARIRKLIILLEHVRHRPGMYLGSHNPHDLELFLTGLQAAYRIFGVDIHISAGDLYKTILIEHGWDIGNSGASLCSQMEKKGIDDETILNTLIDVEVAVLKSRYGVEVPIKYPGNQ